MYDISSRYLQKLITHHVVRDKVPAAYLPVLRTYQTFLVTCQHAQDAKRSLITQGGPGASGVGYGNFEVSLCVICSMRHWAVSFMYQVLSACNLGKYMARPYTLARTGPQRQPLQ